MSYQRKVFIGDTSNTCVLNYQHDYIIQTIRDRDVVTNDVREADIIVFAGSCSCTIEVLESFINYVESVLSYIPDRSKVSVYLSGCLTRKFAINNDYFNNIKEWMNNTFDFIIPQNNPKQLLNMLYPNQGFEEKDSFGSYTDPDSRNSHNLYLSTGCNNHCTFCKINYLKWPLQSMSLEHAKMLIDKIADYGEKRHIQIIGSNISQYGFDLYKEHKLPDIVEYIDTKPNITSVGFSGFNFYDAKKYGFQDAFKDSSKITYIGGSLESGSNRILELMGKNGTVEDFLEFVNCIRKKYPKEFDLAIIAGFPTETYEDIMMTLNALQEINPVAVGICRYTDSSFIPSHKLSQLKPEAIQEHTRIYKRVLTKRGVFTSIHMPGYVNNGKY